MTDRKKLWLGGVILIVLGVVLGSSLALVSSNPDVHTHHEQEDEAEDHAESQEIKLTEEQIQRFDIQTMKLTKNNFQHRITLTGQVTLNENAITHIFASVSGTVKEIFKNLGEEINTGEPLATLQSRDMAEEKSDYLTASKNVVLQKDLFERQETLWKQKIMPEVQFIQIRNTYENAKNTLDQAKQKLLALGLTEEQIQNLSLQAEPLNIYTIDSPINGEIIERHLTLGEVVSVDKQVFVVANLDTVWVNLDIPTKNRSELKKDQKVEILAHQGEDLYEGNIMYISPIISEETRTGRAVVQLENKNHTLHSGDFIKARVVVSEQSDLLSLPSSALQYINGNPIVFIKTSENIFVVRSIEIKGSDKGEFVEILSGLEEGDEVVYKNTFLLKAELAKSEAIHSH